MTSTIQPDIRKWTGFRVPHESIMNPSTKEVAYFLGFLWADGFLVTTSGHREVGIEIISSDAIHLLPILTSLGSWRIRERHRKRNGVSCKPITSFLTSNRFLVDYLISKGYQSKSSGSPDAILDTIPVDLRHYFWRGLFDGDGNLYVPDTASKIRLTFGGPFDQDWHALEILFASLGIKWCISRRKLKQSRCSSIHVWRRHDLISFLDYIYQGEPMGFPRKLFKCHEAKRLLAIPRARKGGSRYYGVSPSRSGKWWAYIHKGDKKYYLGTFETQEEAAYAYNVKALELGGGATFNELPAGWSPSPPSVPDSRPGSDDSSSDP